MTSKSRFQIITVFTLIILSLLIFTFYHREGEKGIIHELQGYLGEGVNFLSRPFVLAFNGLKNGLSFINSLKNIQEENRELKERLNYLMIKIKEYSEIEAENERLRRLLNFQKKASLKLVPARVLGSSPRDEERVVVIDKGSKDGIRKGQAVISPDGLVGRIRRVEGNFSLVQLIIDSKSEVGVRLVRSREVGILKSTEEGLRVRLLSIESDVKVGDEVVTSGLGGVYPKGLYVGKVSKVEKDPNSVEKKVWLRSSVSFDTLEEVFVVVGE